MILISYLSRLDADERDVRARHLLKVIVDGLRVVPTESRLLHTPDRTLQSFTEWHGDPVGGGQPWFESMTLSAGTAFE